MAKPIIRADKMDIIYNLGKSNEYHALHEASVEIYQKEYIILFGPSGCGKSTLLYSVLGGLPPANGKMYIKGEDIYAYKPEEVVAYQRDIVGIIYQAFNLIPSINVLDNVALPQIFMGIPLKERSQRASDLLRRFGIGKSLEKKIPATLSGGQQQRVAVARALVNDPEILLADEPVGNLDAISADQVMGKLEEINQKDRKTVILVTHDAKYLPYAHRVYYIKEGVIRRIVVNPEKPQVKRVKSGETIVTEVEQLARLYPYDEPMQLKVKSIINFLTQDLSFTQIERLEKAVLKRLDGKMSQSMFYEFLTKPFNEGGVGLLLDPALEMTYRMTQLIEHSREVKRFRDEAKDDKMFFHQHRYLERICQFLVDEFHLKLTDRELDVVRDIISERVSGFITIEDFRQRLSYPSEDGGVSLAPNLAQEVSRYLEKLIAQGGYIIQDQKE